jgi:hypothetical protein
VWGGVGKILLVQNIMEIDAEEVKDSSLILIKQGAEAVSSLVTLLCPETT